MVTRHAAWWLLLGACNVGTCGETSRTKVSHVPDPSTGETEVASSAKRSNVAAAPSQPAAQGTDAQGQPQGSGTRRAEVEAVLIDALQQQVQQQELARLQDDLDRTREELSNAHGELTDIQDELTRTRMDLAFMLEDLARAQEEEARARAQQEAALARAQGQEGLARAHEQALARARAQQEEMARVIESYYAQFGIGTTSTGIGIGPGSTGIGSGRGSTGYGIGERSTGVGLGRDAERFSRQIPPRD